jgi:hypothetical protein
MSPALQQGKRYWLIVSQCNGILHSMVGGSTDNTLCPSVLRAGAHPISANVRWHMHGLKALDVPDLHVCDTRLLVRYLP